ncbi:unnamed protein product [Oreochromis niloticus]|nr:unnamed protein product [Mustela putorius furo]
MGNSIRSALKEKDEELTKVKQRLTETESNYEEKLEKERSALKEKDEELTTVKQRLTETESNYEEKLEKERSALKEKDEELTTVKQRLTETETNYEEKLEKERSALKEKDEELRTVKQRLTETESNYEEKLEKERSALKEKDEELRTVKQRLTETETNYEEKLEKERSALKEKDEELTTVKQRLTDMEAFYKQKLDDSRSDLKQKEEELTSLKDRLAADVAISIKTADTESMNSPVSKTRLTEMYHKLKLLQWPKIKDDLKANQINPEFTKSLIQKMFNDASEDMDRKRKQIEEIFELIESSSVLTPQKIKELRQLTIQNLQMSLYHSGKEGLKNPLPELEGQFSQDVMMKLRHLASECYWLGCLMALSNPPFKPDWQNHICGLDLWNILPRDIK